MKSSISIDASHYRASRPTGVEQYVDNLLPLLDQELRKLELEPRYLVQERFPENDPLAGAIQDVIPYKRFWSLRAPREIAKKVGPAVYFTPSGIPPLKLADCKTAVTVHDLAVYQAPRAYSSLDTVRLKVALRAAAKRAGAVLVPSTYVAEAVRKIWGIPQHGITVTPLAETNLDQIKAVPPRHGIPKHYMLYIGRIETKKNLAVIVRSFALYRQNGGKHSLVIAGAPGYGAGALYALVGDLPEEIRKTIYLVGYVTDAERTWLFTHAICSIVPSPYEGFGIPVLEAFRAEVPVLASDAGALPEVVGDAGILVAPKSPAAWQHAFHEIEDRALRAKLIALGVVRGKQYTWKKTAKTTAKALKSLVNN